MQEVENPEQPVRRGSQSFQDMLEDALHEEVSPEERKADEEFELHVNGGKTKSKKKKKHKKHKGDKDKDSKDKKKKKKKKKVRMIGTLKDADVLDAQAQTTATPPLRTEEETEDVAVRADDNTGSGSDDGKEAKEDISPEEIQRIIAAAHSQAHNVQPAVAPELVVQREAPAATLITVNKSSSPLLAWSDDEDTGGAAEVGCHRSAGAAAVCLTECSFCLSAVLWVGAGSAEYCSCTRCGAP